MSKLYFTKDHEWLYQEQEDSTLVVGITKYAQEQLGDLVFVDLPEIGQEIKKDEAVVVVESVKAASDVYAPIDGTVVEINKALLDDPSLVNQDAQGEGWLWKMRSSDPRQLEELLSESDYEALIG